LGTTNPTGFALVISTTVKSVLFALVLTGVLSWDDATTTAVALAIAAVVDLFVMLGIVKPRTIPVNPGPAPTEHTDA
jgi:hypothetical protein